MRSPTIENVTQAVSGQPGLDTTKGQAISERGSDWSGKLQSKGGEMTLADATVNGDRDVPDEKSADSIKKRSVVIGGHRTSISLEEPFWDVLKDIAADRKLSVNQIVTEIDRGRRGNLSSAIRIYVLQTLLAAR